MTGKKVVFYVALALGCLVLAGFAGAYDGGWGFPAHVHLALAAGVMPLMLAAISHFGPVLCATRLPGTAYPFESSLAAFYGGVCAVLFFITGESEFAILGGISALLAVGWFAFSLKRMTRTMLGPPHPGFPWYFFSILFLLLGLLLGVVMAAFPEFFIWVKPLHLHVNLLGWIGMTVLGTLHVLMPTVMESPFNAPRGLTRRLLPSVVGVGLVGISHGVPTVSSALLGLAGAGCLAWVWGGFLLEIRTAFGEKLLSGRGLPLLLAPVGFLLALTTGALHGIGILDDASLAGHLFAGFFLLPVVTGAAQALVPVWLAGPKPARVKALREEFYALGRHRGVAYATGAFLAVTGNLTGLPGLGGLGVAIWLLGVGSLIFQVVLAVRAEKETDRTEGVR